MHLATLQVFTRICTLVNTDHMLASTNNFSTNNNTYIAPLLKCNVYTDHNHNTFYRNSELSSTDLSSPVRQYNGVSHPPSNATPRFHVACSFTQFAPVHPITQSTLHAAVNLLKLSLQTYPFKPCAAVMSSTTVNRLLHVANWQ